MQDLKTKWMNSLNNFSQANRMYKQTIARPVISDRFLLLSTIAALIFLSALNTTEAAEWRIEPILRVGGDFNDNPYLSIGTEHSSESGTVAEGSMKVSYAADTSDFYITPRLRSRSYGSDSDLDSDDQFLRMQFNRNTPTSNFRIRADYNRESVRTAEIIDTDFDIEDPDEIISDDSGRVDIRDRRERLVLSPSYLYHFSDVSAVSARLDYNDVRYDDAFQGQLVDYADTRMNLSYRRSWTPRNTAIVSGTFRNYQTDQGNNETNGVGFMIGFDREMSQTTVFRATAGLEDTEVGLNDSEVDWVANVSFSRRLETITLLAQYRRSISASGSGRLGARDSLNLNFTRDLSERFSAGIGARVYATNAIGDLQVNFDERSYVQLRSQFIWHVSEVFNIEANYRYTFLERESFVESSNGNDITLWFTYQPLAITRSR
jgi:hypothetical protein